MEDGRASAGWALYEPCEECGGQGRVVPCVKVLFRSTILVDGRLDSNSAYRAEAVGIFTVTIVSSSLLRTISGTATNYHIPHLQQQRISEMHQNYYNMKHINSLLQTTQLQPRMASQAYRVMAGG